MATAQMDTIKSVSYTHLAAQETMRMVFQFVETNPLSGYALFNLTERFGQKVFVHGGVEPFIRLSTDRCV